MTNNSKASAWWVWLLAAMFYFYQFIPRTMTAVFVDDMMTAFNITSGQVGWLSSGFYMGYILMLIPTGFLLDRYGPKVILSFAGFFCALGCYLFVVTDNFYIALLGRILTGAGSSPGFVGTLATASLWFPPRKFAMLNGLTFSAGTLGGALAPPLIAKLNVFLKWDQIIIMLSIFGCILSFCIMFLSKRHPTKKKSAMFKSAAKDEVTMREGIRLILSSYDFWMFSLFGLLVYSIVSGFIELWSIQFLQIKYSITEAKAAFMNSFFLMGISFGGLVVGRFSNFLHSRVRLFQIYMTILLVIFSLVIYLDSLPIMLASILLTLGGFFFSAKTICFTCIKEITPDNLVSKTYAFSNVVVMLSGTIFQPLLGKLIHLKWDGRYIEKDVAGRIEKLPLYTLANYKFAFSVLIICILASLVLTLFMKETYRYK